MRTGSSFWEGSTRRTPPEFCEVSCACQEAALRPWLSNSDTGLKLGEEPPIFFMQREHIMDLVAKSRIPTMFGLSESARAGGLMSYDVNNVGNRSPSQKILARLDTYRVRSS